MWLPTASASAGDVSGNLEVPPTLLTTKPPRGCAEHSCYWNEPNGVYPPRTYRSTIARHLSVVLTSQRSKAPFNQVLSLQGGGFLPGTLVAANGSTLTVSNADGFQRSPFAKGLKEFNFPEMRTGDSRAVKLLATGHWTLKDTLVPHADGYLHVVTNLVAIGTLGESGSFLFTDIEPGRYKLVVYYHEHMLTSQAIEVPSKGKLKLDPISLPTPKPR